MTDSSSIQDAVPEIKLRSYQQEMLEQSIERNVIVAMDTGSGKTHIALARIQHQLEYDTSTRLIWFITPNIALSDQQHALIDQQFSGYGTLLLTGNSGVDTWTDQCQWDALLLNVRIVVGTPAVLSDALSHGFVTMSRLALCIFDEGTTTARSSVLD